MTEIVLQNQNMFRHKSVDGFAQPRRAAVNVSRQPVASINTFRKQSDLLARRLVMEESVVHADPVQPASVIETVLQNEQPIVIKRSHIFKKYALLSLIVLTFVGGMGIFAMTLRTNHQASAQVAAITEQSKTGATSGGQAPAVTPPSEEPVTTNAVVGYKVAADLPRVIRISKIKVEARVMQIDVLADGSLDTPKNTNDAAWYTGSSKPGQPWAMLIDGHASGATKGGVFYNLHKLLVGDGVSIERGDGTIFNYKVVKKEQVDAANVDMGAALSPITAGKSGLNIITCGGTFDQKTQTFDQRVVIYTEQV
jgi:LPXTG-site transpeptidase (sortase) family protein